MRYEGQRWKLHPQEDGRELVSCVSSPDKQVAEDAALGYATALEKKGFTLTQGMGRGPEIRATKGSETYAICIEEKAS